MKSRVTINELLWFELNGKNAALDRYDSIIWKIRAGYAVILYGVLTLIAGKSETITTFNSFSIFLIWGLSLIMFIIDLSFRLRQVRVIIAINELIDITIKRTGEDCNDKIRNLLHIAGDPVRTTNKMFIYTTKLFESFLIFIVSPITISLIFFFCK